MQYNDVLTRITYLTKRNNISNTELGEVINVERRAMNGRAERNSKFKSYEIEQIENYYDINLTSVSISDNSCKRLYDDTLQDKFENFGEHLAEIQEKNNILDSKMAVLLDVSEDYYLDIKNGKAKPDYDFIFAIKQNFKVSIDWLLFGD